MSFVIAQPEMIAAAAGELASIRSAINAANAAAAAQTTGVMSAAADEVSTAVAALFSSHAQAYQAASAQAAAFHAQVVRTLTVDAGAYASAEAANAGPNMLAAVNAPAQALLGRPLIGNGANGAPGTGQAGGDGGLLFGNGGNGGAAPCHAARIRRRVYGYEHRRRSGLGPSARRRPSAHPRWPRIGVPDIWALPGGAAAAVRDQARARRRRRVTRRGYGDEFMDMNIDVDPDWGPPPGEDPVTSTVASDRGAGHLGFAGTARREAVADAAGMTTLAGDDFGDGPTTPMVPGSWDPDRDAPGSAEPGDRG